MFAYIYVIDLQNICKGLPVISLNIYGGQRAADLEVLESALLHIYAMLARAEELRSFPKADLLL